MTVITDDAKNVPNAHVDTLMNQSETYGLYVIVFNAQSTIVNNTVKSRH